MEGCVEGVTGWAIGEDGNWQQRAPEETPRLRDPGGLLPVLGTCYLAKVRVRLLILPCVAGLLATAGPAPAQQPGGTGRVLYMTYCATCHGASARGDGPSAPALRKPPADLTRLAEKYGVPLPKERLAEFIDGRRDILSHGTREMPIWGRRFYEGEQPGMPDVEGAKRRTIELLVEYLISIQAQRETRLEPEQPFGPS